MRGRNTAGAAVVLSVAVGFGLLGLVLGVIGLVTSHSADPVSPIWALSSAVFGALLVLLVEHRRRMSRPGDAGRSA